MGIPPRQLGDDEHVVISVRPHGRVLVGPVLVLFVVAPVTAVMAGFVPGGTFGSVLRTVILVLGSIVVLRGALVPFLDWRRTTYTVTNQRVALRRGVLRRFGRDVPLRRVSGVTFSSGPLERLLGSGRIRIEAAGESPLVLDDVPSVEQVQRAVQKYAGLAGADEPDDDLDDDLDDAPDEADDDADAPDGDDLVDDHGEDVGRLPDDGYEIGFDEGDDEDDEGYEDDEAYEDEGFEDEDVLDDDGAEQQDEVDDVTWRRRGRGGWRWGR